MIPKKIHYCWLSNDPMPTNLLKCLDSWKNFLPDYEFIKWDLNRFPLEKKVWVKQAFEQKKYAFAADYIRLYALYHEGGIYLDSDVEVLKSFNDLLYLPYFICWENGSERIEAATFGAEPGCEWIKKCLKYYDNRSFIDSNGNLNTKVLPLIIYDVLRKDYTIQTVDNPINQIDHNTIHVLPFDYFSPRNYVSKEMNITSRTYSIHHFAGSWIPWWRKCILTAWLSLKSRYPRLTTRLKSLIDG